MNPNKVAGAFNIHREDLKTDLAHYSQRSFLKSSSVFKVTHLHIECRDEALRILQYHYSRYFKVKTRCINAYS